MLPVKNNGERLKCQSVEEWINRMQHIQVKGHFKIDRMAEFCVTHG